MKHKNKKQVQDNVKVKTNSIWEMKVGSWWMRGACNWLLLGLIWGAVMIVDMHTGETRIECPVLEKQLRAAM